MKRKAKKNLPESMLGGRVFIPKEYRPATERIASRLLRMAEHMQMRAKPSWDHLLGFASAALSEVGMLREESATARERQRSRLAEGEAILERLGSSPPKPSQPRALAFDVRSGHFLGFDDLIPENKKDNVLVFGSHEEAGAYFSRMADATMMMATVRERALSREKDRNKRLLRLLGELALADE